MLKAVDLRQRCKEQGLKQSGTKACEQNPKLKTDVMGLWQADECFMDILCYLLGFSFDKQQTQMSSEPSCICFWLKDWQKYMATSTQHLRMAFGCIQLRYLTLTSFIDIHLPD